MAVVYIHTHSTESAKILENKWTSIRRTRLAIYNTYVECLAQHNHALLFYLVVLLNKIAYFKIDLVKTPNRLSLNYNYNIKIKGFLKYILMHNYYLKLFFFFRLKHIFLAAVYVLYIINSLRILIENGVIPNCVKWITMWSASLLINEADKI